MPESEIADANERTNAGFADVTVVGAGPVGCVAALAQARAGKSVVLFEGRPRGCERLAGEWLHPRGVSILRTLGVDLLRDRMGIAGQGFLVEADDHGGRVQLPYANGDLGCSIEHNLLVRVLREAVEKEPGITYRPNCRVTSIAKGEVTWLAGEKGSSARQVTSLVIGADGRKSTVRRGLGLPDASHRLSRMLGLRLRGLPLPEPGYGHIFLAGPGPVLAYAIGEDEVRLCLDIPFDLATDPATIFEAYAPVLPDAWGPGLRVALGNGSSQWASNERRTRTSYGGEAVGLVGDAVGFQHPLTAAGMTQGFLDAVALAEEPSIVSYARRRAAESRTPECLAQLLHETFTEANETSLAIREQTRRAWHESRRLRRNTMRLLACEDTRLSSLAGAFAAIAVPALIRVAKRGLAERRCAAVKEALLALPSRALYLVEFSRRRPILASFPAGAPSQPERRREAPQRADREVRRRAAPGRSAAAAIARGRADLAGRQFANGRFEGEVVWCPMLAAQYVLFCEVLGREIEPTRRRGLLRHFESSELPGGLWGLHSHSEPTLFVTTLVYVASRLLGEPPTKPSLSRARAFIEREGVLAIPSWGKFWLCLVGLYDWRGAPPVLPEIWRLPSSWFIHPAAFYCHTRSIYMAMSSVQARGVCATATPRLRDIRDELHPQGMAEVNWEHARRSLRAEEIVTPPSLPLRIFNRAMVAYRRFANADLRQRALDELDERIRFELETTSHTSISPVSGLLNILALHSADPDDPIIERALAGLEAWFWEDEAEGSRIAGARSATWDTGFALQALAASSRSEGSSACAESIERAASFLEAQQISAGGDTFRRAYRIDPEGGFCFASGWHGWPVSDCTAEALDALARVRGAALDPGLESAAIDFLLRCQNPDGGFGSYEARRSRFGLEWLNPAEMFAESMSEHSYVECTASAICALAGYRERHPDARPARIDRAIERAERRLRGLQSADGSFRGVWGVHYLYGTWFGIRGLMAAGAGREDPAVRRARAWIRSKQHTDGGFGEHHRGTRSGHFCASPHSQVIQTSWALLALLEAGETDWEVIRRAAEFLIDRQAPNGEWPEEEPAGLFFRTALLDYRLYRVYFPLWALGLYEDRRRTRSAFGSDRSPNPNPSFVGSGQTARDRSGETRTAVIEDVSAVQMGSS